MGWLKDSVTVADVGRWRHTEAADYSSGDLGGNVAENILGHDDVVALGVGNEHHRARIDILAVGTDVRVTCRNLVEHLAHEGLAGERIGLIKQGDVARRATG